MFGGTLLGGPLLFVYCPLRNEKQQLVLGDGQLCADLRRLLAGLGHEET